MAKRDEIYQAIIEGGATKESLMELVETTDKGLASQFTYLRMMGKCPMKQEDGTFKIVSAEEWEAHKASSAGRSPSGKIRTPAERAEMAQKKADRTATAYDNAKKRSDNDPDNLLLDLKTQWCDLGMQIANIELANAEEVLRNAPPEETEPEDADAEYEGDAEGDLE